MREMVVSGRGRRNKKQRLGWAIKGRQRKGRTSPATCWRRHSLLKLTNSTIQRKGRPQSNRNIHQKNPKKGFDHREGASKDRYKRWHLPTWRSIPEAWSLTKKCEQRAKSKIKSNNSNRITLATSHYSEPKGLYGSRNIWGRMHINKRIA